MALTTIAGNTAYPLRISSSSTGSAGSETPDGNIVYFYIKPDEMTYVLRNLSRNKPIYNGAQEYSDGKRAITVSFNTIIKPEGANSATTELNAIIDFIHDYSIDQGASKCYLWYYNTIETTYIKLGRNSSQVCTNYLIGYFTQFSLKPSNAKIYYPAIQFREATT